MKGPGQGALSSVQQVGEWMNAQIIGLVVQTFRERLVGVSPKMQSHAYRGWPTVDNTNSHKDTNDDVFALHTYSTYIILDAIRQAACEPKLLTSNNLAFVQGVQCQFSQQIADPP